MDIRAVKNYLLSLQEAICNELSDLDGAEFATDAWERPEGGGGRSRVLSEGALIEKGGVNFSHVQGASMPHPLRTGWPMRDQPVQGSCDSAILQTRRSK